jgi:hypothetical protein
MLPQGMGSSGASALELLLSGEGEMVRDIITEELAKGIDAAWRIAFDEVRPKYCA